jgi:hypothetical protein
MPVAEVAAASAPFVPRSVTVSLLSIGILSIASSTESSEKMVMSDLLDLLPLVFTIVGLGSPLAKKRLRTSPVWPEEVGMSVSSHNLARLVGRVPDSSGVVVELVWLEDEDT